MINLTKCHEKNMKIPNRRTRENTMVKKELTTIYKTLHRKLMIGEHKPY